MTPSRSFSNTILAVLQHHLVDRPHATDQALPNMQEPVPFELLVQVVQLVAFFELSDVQKPVLAQARSP
jgi:hypothetical protein